MKLAKLLAVAVNLVAFVAAGVGLGFGIFALVDGQAVAKLFEHVSGGDFTLHVFGVAAVLVVAASSVLLITSFSGCCGAYLVRDRIKSLCPLETLYSTLTLGESVPPHHKLRPRGHLGSGHRGRSHPD